MALWKIKAGSCVRVRGAVRGVVAVAMVSGLGACSVPNWANPVEWYRDVSGVSKNDSPPEERNTQNLEKGNQQPYPPLSSVPPPPTNALSAAEREQLRNSLTADRANAKYVEANDQYVPVPPKVTPSPPVATPASLPAPTADAVRATPIPGPTPPAASAQSALPPTGARPPNRGGQAPPRESTLTPPSVSSVPQGETPRPAPPPPPGVPTGQRPASASAPAPLPPQSATLPPPARPPSPDFDADTAGAALPAAVGLTVGSVEFAGNATKLAAADLQRIREVAQLGLQNGATVRVTAYSEPPGSGRSASGKISSFNLALDRARTVAVALSQAGVPARAVEIAASPAPPGQHAGVVEMSLEY